MSSLFGITLPTAAGNTLGALSTKVQESANKAVQEYVNVPFTKVSASFESSIKKGAAQVQGLLGDSKKAGDDIDAQLARLEAAAEGVRASLGINALTVSQAQSNAEVGDEEVSAQSMNDAAGRDGSGADDVDSHIIQLREVGSDSVVKFINMPEVTESRTVEYEAVAPPQSPAAFQKYKGTSSVQWSVNATLTSRTTDEATLNLEIMNMLRGWSMPYFGENTRVAYPSKLGAPPPVLIFSGFRNQMIGPVPVIITSLNWSFTQDIDYIPAREFGKGGRNNTTGKLIPFPTVIKVAIQLVESYSTDQFNGFDLAEFRVGQFANAWKSLKGGAPATVGPAAGAVTEPEPAQTVLPNSLRGGNGYGTLQSATARVGTEVGRATNLGAAKRIGTEVGRATNLGTAITERQTAIYRYPERLPISPTASEGNVEDLSLG